MVQEKIRRKLEADLKMAQVNVETSEKSLKEMEVVLQR